MEKKLDDAYDDPLVGCIRTYCNEDKDMESRYNVKVFLVTGYSEKDDAFRVTEIPYIPKGVGVLLYTTDATVDILGPEKEWKGEKVSNIEEAYGKNRYQDRGWKARSQGGQCLLYSRRPQGGETRSWPLHS